MDNNRGGEYTKIAHHLLYLSCTKGKIWVGVERGAVNAKHVYHLQYVCCVFKYSETRRMDIGGGGG